MWRSLLSLPKPLAIMMWLSLALNIFLVSAILTQRLAPNTALVREGVDRPLARLIAKLPHDDARIVREAQRGQRVQMATARTEFDAALAAAARTVAQEPLDPAAVQRALDELRRKRQAITEVRIQLYAQVIPRLSSEGRRQLTLPD
jgi:uncharacterized membrane protein